MTVALVLLLGVTVLTAHTVVNAGRWLRRPADRPVEVTEPVAVLLPLRDEADRALLASGECPGCVSWCSTTARATAPPRWSARSSPDDPRVTLLTGVNPPPGWLGKPHACWQLATRVEEPVTALVFVDADVVLEPYAVAVAVTELRAAGATLLSPYPRIVVRTMADRLVQPLLQWLWLTFLPLRAMERSPRPSLAAAGGQFLVVDRAGYLRAGGHAAVADRVLEDIELARAVKRAGGRIALADGSRLASCRMYEDWPQLRDGYTKSLWASFGHPGAAAVVLTVVLALYTAPPLVAGAALLAGAPTVARIAVGAYLAGVAGRVVSAGPPAAVPGPTRWAIPCRSRSSVG